MSGPRRLNCVAGVTVAALVLAVAVVAGCGSSGLSASVPNQGSSVAADPPPAPPVAVGTSPDTARGPSAPSSSTAVAPTGPRTRHPIPPAHPVPAAFRPAPGAPSDAEVRSELAQLDAIQREEHQRALSAAAASLAGLLPWSMEPKSGAQVSVASVFRDYGLGLACGGVLGRDELGVAHKTAPCGTLITFTYAGRSLTVPVIDRGPYVAGREWDLTGATAAALAFPGLGQIQWSVAG
jgi:rare lipoprotein A (peptidoglycan hydrolase)